MAGKYIFHFDPAINLGRCGGARPATAPVAMVGESAKSDVPMLGYTVPYAVSNILRTWGAAVASGGASIHVLLSRRPGGS